MELNAIKQLYIAGSKLLPWHDSSNLDNNIATNESLNIYGYVTILDYVWFDAMKNVKTNTIGICFPIA